MMQLKISKNLDTKDLKDLFSSSFEGLKLEFFRKSHESQEGSPIKDMIKGSMPLGAIYPDMVEGDVNFDESMEVRAVEGLFESMHIHVQVFRMMGRSWIETTRTDSYTLADQCAMSKESLGH